jgi:hypothetical protein
VHVDEIGRVSQMGEMKNEYRVLVGRRKSKKTLLTARHKFEINTKAWAGFI